MDAPIPTRHQRGSFRHTTAQSTPAEWGPSIVFHPRGPLVNVHPPAVLLNSIPRWQFHRIRGAEGQVYSPPFSINAVSAICPCVEFLIAASSPLERLRMVPDGMMRSQHLLDPPPRHPSLVWASARGSPWPPHYSVSPTGGRRYM